MAQDLQSICAIDFEQELINLLSQEIREELKMTGTYEPATDAQIDAAWDINISRSVTDNFQPSLVFDVQPSVRSWCRSTIKQQVARLIATQPPYVRT